jgi:hypothetical protein
MRERQGSRMLPENRIALQVDALDATPSLHVPPVVADEFVDGYICWREECVAVESAYEQWRGMEGRDRPVAYAAYRAALDREEHAAQVFRDCAERVFGATV